jgi:hypothetical protein
MNLNDDSLTLDRSAAITHRIGGWVEPTGGPKVMAEREEIPALDRGKKLPVVHIPLPVLLVLLLFLQELWGCC